MAKIYLKKVKAEWLCRGCDMRVYNDFYDAYCLFMKKGIMPTCGVEHIFKRISKKGADFLLRHGWRIAK